MIIMRFTAIFFSLFLFPITSFWLFKFTDVSNIREDYSYIRDLLKKWIIDSWQHFRPDEKINRAEFTKIIILWTKWVADNKIAWHNSFADIKVQDWFWPYIQSARYYWFLHWYPDFTFKPSKEITIWEALKIILNATNLPEIKDNWKLYRNLKWNEWFYSYAVSGLEYWIYNWRVGTNWLYQWLFDSSHKITRWEMATIFSKALKLSDEFYRK
jgi:hypothetical protein